MLGFRPFLTRSLWIWKDSKSTAAQPVQNQQHLTRNVNVAASDFDIANAKVKEIKVGCWLHTGKLRWGRIDREEIAITQMTIQTCPAANCDVTRFEIDLNFSDHVHAGRYGPAPENQQSRNNIQGLSQGQEVYLGAIRHLAMCKTTMAQVGNLLHDVMHRLVVERPKHNGSGQS